MSRRFYDTTAADDIHKYIFIVLFFLKKIRLDVSSESSARQSIHMKNQASPEDKSKKLICRLLQFLIGALRVHAEFSSLELFFLSYLMPLIPHKRYQPKYIV